MVSLVYNLEQSLSSAFWFIFTKFRSSTRCWTYLCKRISRTRTKKPLILSCSCTTSKNKHNKALWEFHQVWSEMMRCVLTDVLDAVRLTCSPEFLSLWKLKAWKLPFLFCSSKVRWCCKINFCYLLTWVLIFSLHLVIFKKKNFQITSGLLNI